MLFGLIFLLFSFSVFAADCPNREPITVACECDGLSYTSGYCCYYDPGAGNVTWQSTTCGYTKWSPHWGHILTAKEDYRYYPSSTRSAEVIWSALNHDLIITFDTADEIIPFNPNIPFYEYKTDLTFGTSTSDQQYLDLVAFASAGGYNLEDAFVHFSEDTVIDVYSSGQVSITGCPVTPVQSCRAMTSIWTSDRWIVNVKSDLAKNFRAYQFNLITTTPSPGGNVLEGLFLDEHPYFPHEIGNAQLVSGGGILEYGGVSIDDVGNQGVSGPYYADVNNFLAAIENGMQPDKKLIPNHAEYCVRPEAIGQSLAASGAFFEFMLDQYREKYRVVEMWDTGNQLMSAGKIVVFSTRQRGDSQRSDRNKITELAMYYLGKDVENKLAYFDILGGWNHPYTYHWIYAQEVDIGTPTSDYYIYQTGTDPNGWNYDIFARNFTKALVLFRPSESWAYTTYDDTTMVTVNLPEIMTPIDGDGNPLTPLNQIILRNAEGAILLSSGMDSCGNGTIEAGEQCDDDNLINGDGCNIICQIESGWECVGEPSVCTELCGNGVIDTGEDCDGTNLNGQTCEGLGYESGALACTGSCVFDTLSCVVPPGISGLTAWTTANSDTLIHTIPSGNDRFLVVASSYEDDGFGNAPDVSSITYGGQLLAFVNRTFVGSPYVAHAELWYLDESGIAAASDSTITLAWAGTAPSDPVLSAGAFENVDQISPITESKVANTALGTPNPLEIQLNTYVGGYGVAVYHQGDAGVFTWNNGWTKETESVSGSSTQTVGTHFELTLGQTIASAQFQDDVRRHVVVGATLNPTDTQSACTLPYDFGTCDCIDNLELLNTINGWYADKIGMAELILNIKTWKICSD